MTAPPADVIIIGYGPVGQTLAILLAQRGHRVDVVERFAHHYPRPRAVVFDDEVARILAGAGVAGKFSEFSEPNLDYEWRNAAAETILRFDLAAVGRAGWPESNMVTQPRLEAALSARAESFGNVRVLRSAEAVGLEPHDDHVEVTVRGPGGGHETLSARYIVGCDGANSFVRKQMGISFTDLGFFYDWLICDVIPHEQRAWSPVNLQVCDPRRPTTVVSGGPGRRRWEFMRMPDDAVDTFDTDDTAWRLLAAWDITPDNATLERKALYTFQARWADNWRDGRVLIAGDAAHLMPPFAGQGMCSGIRDAANLAWKLDLVLRGSAAPGLLSTYTTERCAHVQHAIHLSMELGRVICQSDPAVAAERDAALIAAGARPETALPAPPPAELGPGVLQCDPDGTPRRPAGRVGVQGHVRAADGRIGLLDDIVGPGWHILADGERVSASALRPSPAHDTLLATLGARLVRVVPAHATSETDPGDAVADIDDVLLPHLRACGHAVQIVRPDFYIFGGTADPATLTDLLTDLERTLSPALR